MINDDNMNRVIERYFQKTENNLVSVIDSCLLCYYYSEFLKDKDKIKSIYYYEKGYSTYYCYLRYQEPLNCPLGVWYGNTGLLYLSLVFPPFFELNKYVDNLENFVLEKTQWLQEYKESYCDSYDIVRGISGVGLYFLNKYNSIKKVEFISKYMLKLFHKGEEEKNNFLYYYINKVDKTRNSGNNGILNLTASHGIIGVVKYLSLYIGFISDEQEIKEYRNYIIKIIDLYKLNSEEDFCSSVIHFDDNHIKTGTISSRQSWCYGQLGELYVLLQISYVLNDASLKEVLKDKLNTILERDIHSWKLECPTFCHGLSGAKKILENMKNIFPYNSNILNNLEFLTQKIEKLYSSKFEMGWRKVDRENYTGRIIYDVENRSAIEGIASILIVYFSNKVSIGNDVFSYMTSTEGMGNFKNEI